MEVYLPPDESELFKDVCLDQKVLFQIIKGVQAFIFMQPLPLQLPSHGPAATLFSEHFSLSGLLLRCLRRAVFSISCHRKAKRLLTKDLTPTFGIKANLPFPWLCKVLYHLLPACCPTGELKIPLQVSPFQLLRKYEWLELLPSALLAWPRSIRPNSPGLDGIKKY